MSIWDSLDALILSGPPAHVVGQCDGCGDDLYQGNEVLVHDHRIYCSEECLHEHLGIRRVLAEEAYETIYGGDEYEADREIDR